MKQKKILKKEYLKFGDACPSCVHFFESTEMPNHFLIDETSYYKDFDSGLQLYKEITRKIDFGDACAYVNVTKPFSIGVFSGNFAWRFTDFVKEKYASQHIPHKRGKFAQKCWFVMEKFEPEKWLDEFILIEQKKIEEREAELRKQEKPHQLNLF